MFNRSIHDFNGDCAVIGCSNSHSSCEKQLHSDSKKFFTLDFNNDIKPDLVTDITKPLPEGLNNRFKLVLLEHIDWHAYNSPFDEASQKLTRENIHGKRGFDNAFAMARDDGFILIIGCPRVKLFRDSFKNLKYIELKNLALEGINEDCVLIPKNQRLDISQVRNQISQNAELKNIIKLFKKQTVNQSIELLEYCDAPYETFYNNIREELAANQKRKPEPEIYLRAYKDQEFQHKWRRYLGRAIAIIAAIIPPISLIFFIYRLMHDDGYKIKPVWQKIGAGALFAFVPILSGVMSWHTVDWMEEERRENDDIKKCSFLPTEIALEKEKRTREKNKMAYIDWQALKEEKNKENTPKKVIIHYKDKNGDAKCDVYMDRAQNQRREAIKCGSTLRPTTDFFKRSYKQSTTIAEKLQKKYKRCA